MNVHGMEVNLDLEALSRLRLSPDIFKSVKNARMAAAEVIFDIVPEHISSWADLIRKLEFALQRIKTEASVEQRLASIPES